MPPVCFTRSHADAVVSGHCCSLRSTFTRLLVSLLQSFIRRCSLNSLTACRLPPSEVDDTLDTCRDRVCHRQHCCRFALRDRSELLLFQRYNAAIIAAIDWYRSLLLRFLFRHPWKFVRRFDHPWKCARRSVLVLVPDASPLETRALCMGHLNFVWVFVVVELEL